MGSAGLIGSMGSVETILTNPEKSADCESGGCESAGTEPARREESLYP